MSTSTAVRPPSDTRPLLLVPGYWLSAWVWEPVLRPLADQEVRAEAVTLPGLESARSERGRVRFRDHVAHVVERLREFDEPPVLVVHSGSGAVASAVADTAPERIARIVYVDSGPCVDGHVPVPDLATDLPFPGLDELAAEGVSIEGLDERDRARFQELALPHPAGACGEPVRLSEPRRNAVPTTLVCCSIRSETVRDLVAAGAPMFAAVDDLTDLSMVDLPTGHWPMLSRPRDLARILSAEASRV